MLQTLSRKNSEAALRKLVIETVEKNLNPSQQAEKLASLDVTSEDFEAKCEWYKTRLEAHRKLTGCHEAEKEHARIWEEIPAQAHELGEYHPRVVSMRDKWRAAYFEAIDAPRYESLLRKTCPEWIRDRLEEFAEASRKLTKQIRRLTDVRDRLWGKREEENLESIQQELKKLEAQREKFTGKRNALLPAMMEPWELEKRGK